MRPGESVAKLDGWQSGGAYANWREAFHLGIDKPDLLEVRAPKPTLIMSTTDDPAFPVSGSRAAEREARQVSEPHECAGLRVLWVWSRLLAGVRGVRERRKPGADRGDLLARLGQEE